MKENMPTVPVKSLHTPSHSIEWEGVYIENKQQKIGIKKKRWEGMDFPLKVRDD